MGDKIVRQLLKTSDGKPSTGKIVKLRPATSADAGSDINLPETPAGSGIYRSASDVPHGVYKEVVNDVETGETLCVEPGRSCYAIASDKTKTALIDKMLTDVVRLSAFSADTVSDADSSDLHDAIIHAATYKKTLIITNDVTLSNPVALGGKNLYIDLNGKTLTFNAAITGGTKVFIRNGSVALLNGSQSVSASVGVAWQDVEFTVNGSSQVVANLDDRYINVRGMPTTIPGTTSTCPIVIGCQGVASADKLLLNSTKLGYLQNFVDNLYANLLAIHNWLTSTKRAALDMFANAPVASRTAFEAGDVAANSVETTNLRMTDLWNVKRLGINNLGYLIDSGYNEMAGAFYAGHSETEVHLDGPNKKFVVLDNSGAMSTTGATITGSPATGAPDVVYFTSIGSWGIDLDIGNGNNVWVRPNRITTLIWNYHTNRWNYIGDPV